MAYVAAVDLTGGGRAHGLPILVIFHAPQAGLDVLRGRMVSLR